MLSRTAVSFVFFLFLLHLPLYGETLPPDHSQWDQILKDHVVQGLVDYEALTKDRSSLDQYLRKLEQYPIDSLSNLSREDRLAFWINLYNASVLRVILDEYPVRQIDQIPAAFEVRTIRAIGEYFSLSELMNEVLRKGFRDERILTALVSGRMDSPHLLNEAFQGQRLEEQLDRAAYEFSESDLNQIKPGSKKIYLSHIFKKFGADFLVNFGSSRETRYSDEESAVISFLLHHLKNPEKRIYLDSARYKIEYLPEDPRLNAVSMDRQT